MCSSLDILGSKLISLLKGTLFDEGDDRPYATFDAGYKGSCSLVWEIFVYQSVLSSVKWRTKCFFFSSSDLNFPATLRSCVRCDMQIKSRTLKLRFCERKIKLYLYIGSPVPGSLCSLSFLYSWRGTGSFCSSKSRRVIEGLKNLPLTFWSRDLDKSFSAPNFHTVCQRGSLNSWSSF